jgi:hypothetical protein
MKKTDTIYLCSNYKETKMLEKVTVGYRQKSRITKLFYNRRYLQGSPTDHSWIFRIMLVAVFNDGISTHVTGILSPVLSWLFVDG